MLVGREDLLRVLDATRFVLLSVGRSKRRDWYGRYSHDRPPEAVGVRIWASATTLVRVRCKDLDSFDLWRYGLGQIDRPEDGRNKRDCLVSGWSMLASVLGVNGTNGQFRPLPVMFHLTGRFSTEELR